MEGRPGATEATIVCFTLERGEQAITLRIQRQNEKEMYYRIGKNMRLGFLMMDYCERKPGTNRFVYEGKRVKENETPKDLKMEDGDVIDALDDSMLYLCAVSKVNQIMLMVILDDSENQESYYYYLTGRNVQLGFLMRDYCEQRGLIFEEVEFLCGGKRVRECQTPEDFHMIDGDALSVNRIWDYGIHSTFLNENEGRNL